MSAHRPGDPAATDTIPAPAPEFDAAGESLTDPTMLPPPALCACAVRGCPYSTTPVTLVIGPPWRGPR